MKKRRFQAQASTIQRDLKRVIDKMGATSLGVNQDIMNGDVEIIFDRAGRRYVFRCSKYENSLDNMRAAQLAISYLWRALTEYGVSSSDEGIERAFSQFFLGFKAVPGDSVLLLEGSSSQWWDILGVDRGADRQSIANAYRSLAKVHHPDAGGTQEDFKRLLKAYDDGRAEAEQ